MILRDIQVFAIGQEIVAFSLSGMIAEPNQER